jgi:hypothetical protein
MVVCNDCGAVLRPLTDTEKDEVSQKIMAFKREINE